MTLLSRSCLVAYWLGLVLWASGLISAAVAAMNVFPQLDAMPLALTEFAGYPVGEHPRIAAGHIMEGVFFLVDVMQMVAAPAVLLLLLTQLTIFRFPRRPVANVLRVTLLLAAAGLFGYHALRLAPPMNSALRGYWAAAASGDVETAHAQRAAFAALHPRADTILRLDLLLVLGAIAASAVALAPAAPASPAGSRAGLESPSLLREPPLS
ncbi:MAG: hypothetical protein HKO59_02380 [Phycisphaerales bacterium]|nr:hypothetical protein [Phycisphaerae bacterium]NNF42009.1 hypothetical protein [Phycisphaerales bacterium]NNM24829.1 hypothetical protein [Phycisphaerales bacterium]